MLFQRYSRPLLQVALVGKKLVGVPQPKPIHGFFILVPLWMLSDCHFTDIHFALPLYPQARVPSCWAGYCFSVTV